ncbi:LCP family protein [Candidatus Saccharibacteria bacterium]|nr:LCP family protein [Candidatus Saccharibacteria bacterium]
MVRDNIETIGGVPVRMNKKPDAVPVRHSSTTSVPVHRKSSTYSLKHKSDSASTPVTVTRRRQSQSVGLSKDNIAKEKAKLQASKDFLSPVSTLNFDLSSKELKPDYSLKHKKMSHDTPRQKIGQKGKAKKKHIARNILITFFVILLLGAGAFLLWGNDIIAKLTGGRSNIFEVIGALGSNVELKADKNGRTNIVVFGTSGYDMSGSEGDGEHDGAQLTDSIMLVSIDQKEDDVAMISLPRDLYVGKTCTSTGKVNEVYYCANLTGQDEESGANALMNTMKDIFDVDVQYYVHLDWAALVQVVDSIGGITVTLDEDIEDTWTETFIKKGEPVTLNGERALGLARARHGTEMGDFTRGNSQQKILEAIQQKIVQNGLDLGSALGLVEAVGDNVRMNFTLEELKTVYSIAKDLDLSQMRQVPLIDYTKNIAYLKTAEMNGISYVVPSTGFGNYSLIQPYVAKMISSNPAVREDAKILILNGSGVIGAASTEKTKLEKEGYQNITTDDAPEGEYKAAYSVYKLSDNAPQTADILSKRFNAELQSAEQLPAGIESGFDIVIIVGTGE